MLPVNEAEFDGLYQAQWVRLVGQVTLVCGNAAEAADCVQEAFVRAWENRAHLDADAGGWVRTAALRIAVSRWRKARNAVAAGTRDHRSRRGDEIWLQAGYEADAPVWRALAKLPAPQREAIVMHHVLDLSVSQVAEVARVPQGTVKARLSRGRAALATALSPGVLPSPQRPPTSTHHARTVPTVPTVPTGPEAAR